MDSKYFPELAVLIEIKIGQLIVFIKKTHSILVNHRDNTASDIFN